jgi:hypothetical protein
LKVAVFYLFERMINQGYQIGVPDGYKSIEETQ